jgi:hypothetical protein
VDCSLSPCSILDGDSKVNCLKLNFLCLYEHLTEVVCTRVQ